MEQALKPFPQYTNVQNLYDDDGPQLTTRFQLQGEKRFSNGLSYLASLTLGQRTDQCGPRVLRILQYAA